MKRRMPVSKRQPLKVVVDGIEDPDKKVALLEYWLDRLRYQMVVDHKAELEPFVEHYKVMEEEASAKSWELGQKIVALRRKLRSGEISNKQYQDQLTPLKRDRKAVSTALLQYESRTLDRIFPETIITVEEVKRYLDEEREWNKKWAQGGFSVDAHIGGGG